MRAGRAGQVSHQLGIGLRYVVIAKQTLIHCPCLLIGGSDSLPLLRRIAHIAADAISGSQFVELAGAERYSCFRKQRTTPTSVNPSDL